MTPNVLHLNVALSFYRLEETPYSTLNLRDIKYSHWLVSHILSGNVVTHSRGIRQTVEAGDVMIHLPGVPFDEIAAGCGVHQWMLFDWRGTLGTEVFHDCPVPPVVRLRDAGRYSEEFRRLMTTWGETESAQREIQIFAGAASLLTQILESWAAMGKPLRPKALQPPRSRFEEIVGYMETHLSEKITRENLAQIAFLHPVYFDRAFRAAHGVSPMQMLREIRLRAAQRRLAMTDDTVESVALACGLGDAAAFSRLFRGRFGQAPGRYRASLKQGSYLAANSITDGRQ